MEQTMDPSPSSIKENLIALMYAISAVSGASGGCTVAAHHILRGKPVATIIVAAYAFVGAVFGIAGISAMLLVSDVHFDIAKLSLCGLSFGFFGSMALAGANLSARFMFKRLGIEVDVSVKRIERRKANRDLSELLPSKDE